MSNSTLKYTYTTDIPEDYQCHHCQGALVDFKKIICECSKIFVCGFCLDNYSECSKCNSKFIITEADEDFADKVKKNIDKLSIYCPYHCERIQLGNIIKTITKISELDNHLKICDKFPQPCKNKDIGCDIVLPLHDLISHEAKCIFTPLRNKIIKDQKEIKNLREQIDRLITNIDKLLDYQEGIIYCHCHTGSGSNWLEFYKDDGYIFYCFRVGLDKSKYFTRIECYVLGIEIIPGKRLFGYLPVNDPVSCHSYSISGSIESDEVSIIIRTNRDAIFKVRWVVK